MNDIILKLEQLGFSSYEAKAYYTLLRKHPANGYEVSKIGKIPAAKIYDTLNRLKVKGCIVESGTESGKYYPIPPETLIKKVKADFTGLIEDLEIQLRETAPVADLDLTVNITGYDALIDKIVEVIDKSQQSLFLSIWPEEAVLLLDAVATAQLRGVTVVNAVFGQNQIEGSYSINLGKCGTTALARLQKRLLAIVSDNREVVIGEIDQDGDAKGIWTTTHSIVVVTKEYIRHDIWGNILIEALGEDRFRTLCETNPLVSYLLKHR